MFMASSTSATDDIKDSGDDTIGHMYGGLIFLKTKKNRRDVVEFYQTLLGMKIWLEQPNMSILSHSNFLLGLQHIKKQDNNSATSITPTHYRICQFFAKDPEGRTLECQAFCIP